jgi:hypothetical protein
LRRDPSSVERQRVYHLALALEGSVLSQTTSETRSFSVQLRRTTWVLRGPGPNDAGAAAHGPPHSRSIRAMLPLLTGLPGASLGR